MIVRTLAEMSSWATPIKNRRQVQSSSAGGTQIRRRILTRNRNFMQDHKWGLGWNVAEIETGSLKLAVRPMLARVTEHGAPRRPFAPPIPGRQGLDFERVASKEGER